MSILQSLIKKETLHVFRDRRTMVITLLMPVLLLLLFGFAISTEVNNVNVVAVVDRHTDETREIIERFSVNPYITFNGLRDNKTADNLLRTGTTDAVVLFNTDNGRL